ncbi:DUF423 domain-containing protein [Bacillus sp. B1-b2]|uniref:DUF423 domain-containing protein n=1 Tax=Bacillus sp. B1-b2 TaxID=2653201 RepID=UPI0012625B41|nr:DUF423 domain-containing protein [Bacillus sp. B1-b2]KAB7670628.1 DUF423 domain-containing protein [Bacillus sp. B1-b2]
MKVFLIIGAINALLSVGIGAFGAHGLEGKISAKYLDIWKTGVTYQMFHSTGLMVIGLLLGKFPESSLLNWAGWLMFSGIILFAGSLYILAVTQIKVLGAITPLGGVAFLTAWLLVVIAVWKWM